LVTPGCTTTLEIDLEDSAQSREHDQHPVGKRQRTTGKPRARAAGHERHPRLMARVHDGGDLVTVARQHRHQRRLAVVQQPVGAIRRKLAGLGEDVITTADRGQALDELAGAGLHQVSIPDRRDAIRRSARRV
jgi:hypothetical protein